MDNKDFMEQVEESSKQIDEIEVIDLSSDVKDIFDNVKETIKAIIKNFIDSLKKIEVSKESINDLIKKFIDNVNDVLENAELKIKSISNNETVILAWEKVKETYKFVTLRIVDLARSGFTYCMGNETIKNSYEAFEKKSNEIKTVVNEKYQEFTHDENVRKVVVSAVNTTKKLKIQIIEKIKDSLK